MSETLPAASAAKTPSAAAAGTPVGTMLFPPRIKRLLAEYTQSAGRSLGGPDDLLVSPLSYKLPPDVELSKTTTVVPASKEENLDDLKKEKAEAAASAAGPNPNGLVTLSRIDDVPTSVYSRMSASAAADERAAQLVSAASDNRMHLTGEMIRQLREQHHAKQSSHHDRERHARSRSLSDVGSAAQAAALPSSRTAPMPLPPVLCSRDRGHADVREALLWGEPIAAFAVGGEMRLCLPKVMQTVLESVSLPVIQAAFDELRMCVSMCSPEQLEALKRLEVLPVTAHGCSLVTQSDAERLCAALLERAPPIASAVGFKAEASPFSFKVQHECFARCVGLLLPEAATSPMARCIECLDCEGVFSPQRFVCHSHRDTAENRTCHWGFDSANWRAYLQVYEGYSEADRERHQKALNHFKAMFAPQKRKQRDESPSSLPSSAPHHKKPRLSSDVSLEHLGTSTLPPPAGAIPVTAAAAASQRTDPYSLYLYNTWAAAASAAHKTHPVHPSQSAAQQAAAVAWTASVAAAFKEGKDLGGFPGFNGGSSFSRHPVASASASVARHTASPPSKSPPPNASLPYSYTSRSLSSPTTKSSPSTSSLLESPAPPGVTAHLTTDRGLASPDVHGDRSSRGSRSGRATLAEEITAIRSALDGASSSARERTLAILERIMARLAEMESERDHAVRELASWQKKYTCLEDEYLKKRGELRDLLGHVSSAPSASASASVPPPRNNGHGLHRSGSHRGLPAVVTGKRAASSSSSEDMPIMSPPSNASSSQKRAFFASGATSLPKVEMKSPARVIEERESSGSSIAEADAESEADPVAAHPAPPANPTNNEDAAKKISQRHRSGTPTSTKSSRDSEDLRDRMMTMEAELRALREELSGKKFSSKDKDNGRPTAKPAAKENGDSGHQ